VNSVKVTEGKMKVPKKIHLANVPTPVEIHKFKNHRFLIKRDDLTGMELSGNKVRKLEFLIYQAKKQNAELVFTNGGEQSNHARATVIAAAKVGIKSKLFLWGKEKSLADGNLFLDKIFGADISFLTRNDFLRVNEIMFEERMKLVKKGMNVYVIPEGGSTTLGIWGYVSFMQEINKQIDLKKISGITSACGSGGTAAGLLVGAALLKRKLKIYAVNVLYSKETIKKKILQLAEGCILEYKLPCEINEDNLEIIDGYSKEGYKNISDDKISLIKQLAVSAGIILDPAYTGKAFNAYYDNFLSKNKGMKNLFLHTGGLYGIFGKRKQYLKIK
jgi:D-cysteine desulfhydrase